MRLGNLLGGALLLSFACASFAQTDTTARRANRAATPQATATRPATTTVVTDARVLTAQPAVAQPTVTDAALTRAASTRYSSVLNATHRDLIAAGNLKAVENGSSVVVSGATLNQHAARNNIFLAFKRAAPEVVAVPAALTSDGAGGGGSATLLRQDVVVPTAAGNAVSVLAFVRNGTGLSYVGARNRFEGRLSVGLDYAEGSAREPLATSVPISIDAPGAESIDPEDLAIQRLGTWFPVALAVNQPDDPYVVRVSAGTKDDGNEVTVFVKRPIVNLATTNPRVAGFGLGTFEVSVAASDLREPAGAIIAFAADGGAFESGNTVKLDAQGTGTLKMRSVGSGLVTIRALPPFKDSIVQVQFIQPWSFLLLAAIGGVIGAVVTRKGRTRWRKTVALGALTGLALAVLYYVGLDWVVKATGMNTLASAGEFVAFALGFIGAIFGVKWIGATT